MERFVRVMLTAFAFFLLIPPWGFFFYAYAIRIVQEYERGVIDRKSTRLNSIHSRASRMPSSA